LAAAKINVRNQP